ncbi:hypothetical protein ABZ726_34965, partial [Streptomyces hundungensis]|uniref:hypothetical protein n=1 Tax=Streptomyces hundungensis TaxID=1077946 RepID=UPI0034061967
IVGPTVTWYDHNVLQDKEHQRRFDARGPWPRWAAVVVGWGRGGVFRGAGNCASKSRRAAGVRRRRRGVG